jgi:hypothetical protein
MKMFSVSYMVHLNHGKLSGIWQPPMSYCDYPITVV